MTHHPEHLSKVPNFEALLAWHKTENVQAVRLTDGTEWLVFRGHVIQNDVFVFSPVQLVINYCAAGSRLKCELGIEFLQNKKV